MRTSLLILWSLVSACAAPRADQAPPTASGHAVDARRLTLLHTSDEHGNLLPITRDGAPAGGVAHLAQRWARLEGRDDSFLLLSSGDNFAGAPAISQWFDGEPTVAAMNALRYDASAVGNHEFDFGQDVLRRRVDQAAFPYLAANLFDAATGERSDLATPSVLLSAGGVAVGVVGLAGQHTPRTTSPAAVKGLRFGDYDAALQEVVPTLRAAGAELIVVLAHDCTAAAEATLPVAGVDVDVWLAGHCHSVETTWIGETPVVNSGEYWGTYSRIDVQLAPGGEVTVQPRLVEARHSGEAADLEPDSELTALVGRWQAAVSQELGESVGWTGGGLPMGWLQGNWVTDAWISALPQADFALLNRGALRVDIPPGPITLEQLVALAPFQNELVLVPLTGAQLVELIAAVGGQAPYLSGGRYRSGPEAEVWDTAGQPVDPQATYEVLLTSFQAAGGDGYPLPEWGLPMTNTGIHYRDPVIAWTREQGSTEAHPLDERLDPAARRVP